MCEAKFPFLNCVFLPSFYSLLTIMKYLAFLFEIQLFLLDISV